MRIRLATRFIIVYALALLFCNAATVAQIQAITHPSKDLSLGFTSTGRVNTVLVKPGDHVNAGQVLAALDDRLATAQVDLLSIRASSELEIKIAEAEWKLAKNEESRVRDAFSADAAGEFEVERLALQSERAHVRLQLAQRKRNELQQQLVQAQLVLEQLSLRSPVDGVIETVTIEPGEMVQQAQPVIRIVVTNPLEIEAAVPTQRTSTLTRDQMVLVLFDLPGVPAEQRGQVLFIAAVADPASDTRTVRIQLDNPARAIPAGIVSHLILDKEPPEKDGVTQNTPSRTR